MYYNARVTKNLLALSLACAALLAACGPARRARLGDGQGEGPIEAPIASAAQYVSTAPAGAGVVGGNDAAGIEAAIAEAANERSLTIRPDPRLATLADWITDHLGPGGEPPDLELVDFFAWHLGLVEPTPHIAALGLPDHASIAAAVRSSASQYFARQPYTHWGAAVRPRDGLWVVVIIFSERHVDLTPIPREVPAGTSIALRGTLTDGYHDPLLVTQFPSGEARRSPAGTGTSFTLNVVPEGVGMHRVEVLAQGPHGDSVVFNVPVYVGQAPPRSITLGASRPAAGGEATTPAAVADELLRLVNETRRSSGLPDLARDPRVDAVALAHSEDMHTNGFVGHRSPTTGGAGDRVTHAGLHSGLVLENVGRGYSAREIHRGLLQSPGHRANLMNADANVFGIGVVAEPEEGGGQAFLVTELFLRFAQQIDTAAARNELFEMVNRARVARGATALTLEPNLVRAADEAAAQFFTEPTLSQSDTVDRASASLRRYSIAFRRVGGLMAVVSSVDEAGQLEPALDGDVDQIGIGVAQGSRPDTGPNAIAVVIVLGWSR